MNKILTRLATVSALLAAAGAAHADLTFYTSASAWTSAVANPQTDNLDDLASVSGQVLGTPVSRTAGSYGYKFYGYDTTDSVAVGVFAAGNASNAFMSVASSGDILIIDGITGGANAFSINLFGVDSDDQFKSYPVTLEILDANGRDLSYTINPTSMTKGSFIGVISDVAIKIVNVYPAWNASQPDAPFVAMDNVTFGKAVAAVPEPSGYALMLGGLGLIGFVARRRRAA